MVHITDGTYLLPEEPSLTFIREIPNLNGDLGEIGLIKVNNKWIISINKTENSGSPPIIIHSIQHRPLFQEDIHSHPGGDKLTTLPSD